MYSPNLDSHAPESLGIVPVIVRFIDPPYCRVPPPKPFWGVLVHAKKLKKSHNLLDGTR
jgi:hypothetical protein